MVRLTQRQRLALGGTVRELANLGFAALVFSQFVGAETRSWRVIAGGILGSSSSSWHCAWKGSDVENGMIMLWGVAAVVGVVVLLDWLAQRKDPRSHGRP